MSITATCGHELTDADGPEGMGWNLALAEYARDNTPAVSHVTYCTACRDAALAETGRVLATEEAQAKWLQFGDPEVTAVGYMVGRFNPLQNGHLTLLQHVHDNNDRLVVLVGSSTEGRTRKNPLTFEERKALLLANFPDALVLALPDLPDDDAWVRAFEETIARGIDSLGLSGTVKARMYSADATRADDYALRCAWVRNLGHEVVGFPPVAIRTDLSASLIRDCWYNGRYEDIAELVPCATLELLRQLDHSGFPLRFQATQTVAPPVVAPLPCHGIWEVRRQSPDPEAEVLGHFEGAVDDIALRLAVSENTVLYFHLSGHAHPQRLEGPVVREFAAVDVVLDAHATLADAPEFVRPFFAGRPVYADRVAHGSCIRLVPLDTPFGQTLHKRRQALDAVLVKLTADDVQVLRDNGLKV